jgi:hypothetical protein
MLKKQRQAAARPKRFSPLVDVRGEKTRIQASSQEALPEYQKLGQPNHALKLKKRN